MSTKYFSDSDAVFDKLKDIEDLERLISNAKAKPRVKAVRTGKKDIFEFVPDGATLKKMDIAVLTKYLELTKLRNQRQILSKNYQILLRQQHVIMTCFLKGGLHYRLDLKSIFVSKMVLIRPSWI